MSGVIDNINAVKHGYAQRGNRSPEYVLWINMKARCNNPENAAYKYYGARGIKICERWNNSFSNFLEDVGLRPSSKHSLDRYPNKDGDYEPNNVRWATTSEQQRNRSNSRYLTINNETKTIAEWAEIKGIPQYLIQNRLRRNWPIDERLLSPALGF